MFEIERTVGPGLVGADDVVGFEKSVEARDEGDVVGFDDSVSFPNIKLGLSGTREDSGTGLEVEVVTFGRIFGNL